MNAKKRFLSVFSTVCMAAACLGAHDAVAQDRIEIQRQQLEDAYKKLSKDQLEKGLTRLEQFGRTIHDLKSDDELRENPLPDDLTLHSVSWDGEFYIVRLEGSFDEALEDESLADYQRQMLAAEIARFGILEDARFEVRTPGSGEFRPLMPQMNDKERSEFLRKAEKFHEEALKRYREQAKAPKLRTKKHPYGGALTGKRILVSAGHGLAQGKRVWSGSSSETFGWQRGNCKYDTTRGVIEDVSNALFVNQWLIPLLRNMGAEVILVRESDMNSDGEVIIDNGEAGYSETGAFADAHQNDAVPQYRFTYGSNFRHSGVAGAKATWTKTFSTSGYRQIQAWYPELGDRPTEVKYTITDAGGKHEVFVNQQQYGRYRDLGKFWAAANKPITVEVERTSNSGELIADAMKFSTEKESLSGQKLPWWKMDAWYYIHHKVFGTTLPEISSRGVGARRELANRSGADLYISMHSNAANTSCDAGGDNVSGYWVYKNTTSQPGTDLFAELVYNAGLQSIHDRFDPNFCPLGVHREDLGEMGGVMPSALVEMAYHNNLKTPRVCQATGKQSPRPDIVALQYPQFREAVARGVADAIAQYFSISVAGGSASNYIKGAGLPPERPTGLKAINGDSPCQLTISWDKTDGAQGYRLYMIDNVRPNYERAWDDGTVTDKNSITLTNLKPGRVYAFKVAALNKNGESFSSPAVTARLRATNQSKRGLYINGYTRWDAYINLEDNDLEYAAEHGIALGAVSDDFYFDGAVIGAADKLDFAPYSLVDFQAGRNSSDSTIMSADMMTKLTNYTNNGGKLLISGSEIGWALAHKGQGKDFFSTVLHGGSFTEAMDDAATYGLKGDGDFAAIGNIQFDDGNHGTYQVLYPDYFNAQTAASILKYDNGNVAGLASNNVILFGMPVETVYPADARAKLVGCSIQKLLYGNACDPGKHGVSDSGAKVLSCDAPAECKAGEAACADENTLKSCANGKWTSTPCGAGKQCKNNACVDKPTDPGTNPDPQPECQSGEAKCQDDATRLVCNDGAWKAESCGEGKYCQNSACVDKPTDPGSTPDPDACQNGEAKCYDDAKRAVCTDGAWEVEACASGKKCRNGACVTSQVTPDAECENGEAYCEDGYLVVCKQNEWRWTSCDEGLICVETLEAAKCAEDEDEDVQHVTQAGADSCAALPKQSSHPFSFLAAIASLFGCVALRRRRFF